MQITLIGEKNLDFFLPLMGDEPSPAQIALGVIEDGMPVAAALFSMEENVCTIDFLRVADTARRKGVGSFLLREAMKAYMELGADRFICFYGEDDAVTGFLSRCGFFCTPSSPLITFRIGDVIDSPRWKKLEQKLPADQVRSVLQLKGGEKEMLARQLEEMGFDRSLLAEGSFDPDISFFSTVSGKIAALLLAYWEDDRVYITLLASFQQSFTSIPGLMSVFFRQLQHSAVQDADVVFLEQNEKITETLNMFLAPEKQAVQTERAWSALYQKFLPG